jgi:GGDEF domain-containing protein
MVRKFIREEDMVAKDNGDVVLILPETDQMGSQALGRRLHQLIRNHPSFQQDDHLYMTAQTLSFQYFTYPDQFNLPAPLKDMLEEMRKGNGPH